MGHQKTRFHSETSKDLNFVTISFLALCFLLLGGSAVSAPYPHDYVCNNQTDFTCVCYQGGQDARGILKDCRSFIKGPNLTVVKIVAKNLDLEEDILSPTIKDLKPVNIRVPLELYFRRRVARILDLKCKKNANLCLGVGINIPPERVAILEARCGAPNETEVLLAVLKESQEPFVGMTTDGTMDPKIVLRFLEEQSALLNTSLGAARIVDMGLETIDLTPGNKDGGWWFESDTFKKNKKMIILLMVIASFLIIIYIIAIFKVISICCAFCRRKCGCGCLMCVEDPKDGPTALYTRRRRAQEKSINQAKNKDYGATSNNIPPPAPPPVPRPTQVIGKSRSNLKNSDSTNSNHRVAPTQEKRPSLAKSISNQSHHKVAVVDVEPNRTAPEPPTPAAALIFKENSPSPVSPPETEPSPPKSPPTPEESRGPSLPPILFQPDNPAYESIRLPVLTTSLRKAISSTSCHKIDEEPFSEEAEEGGTSHSSSDTRMSDSNGLPRSASVSLNPSDSNSTVANIPTVAVNPAEDDEDDSTIGSGGSDGEEPENGLGASTYQALSPAGSIPDFVKDLEEAQNFQNGGDFHSFPDDGEFSGVKPFPTPLNNPSKSFGNASALPSVSINVESPEDPGADSDAWDPRETPTTNPTNEGHPEGLIGSQQPDLRTSQQCLVDSDDEAGSSEEDDSSSLRMNGRLPDEEEDQAESQPPNKPKSSAKRRRRREGAFGRQNSAGETTSSGSLSSLASRNSALGMMDYERLAESGWSLNAADIPPPLPTSEPPPLDDLDGVKPSGAILSNAMRREDSSSPDLR